MEKRRITALLTAGVLALGAFTGCGAKSENTKEDTADGQTASHGNSPVKVTANGHKKKWCKGYLYKYHDDATAHLHKRRNKKKKGSSIRMIPFC